jgi:hypothetical protein
MTKLSFGALHEAEHIWTIETGEYSDYRAVGVFSKEENARRMAEFLENRAQLTEDGDEDSDYFGSEEYRICRLDLDPGIDELNAGLKRYHISMHYDGGVSSAYEDHDSPHAVLKVWRRTKAPAWEGRPVSDAVTGSVWARDEEHAIKIANEVRLQMIACGKMKTRE